MRVELLAPIKGVKSPIDGILSKMGSTPYHICYQVKNIERAINYLQDAGYTLIEAPEYSEPLGGIVCFLYANEIGIIELIQY